MTSAEIPDKVLDRRRRLVSVLRLFMAASQNIRLYPGGHQIVEASIEKLFATLTPALEQWGSVRYDVRGGAVFEEGNLLDMDALLVTEFAADCAGRKIGSLTFLRGVTHEELGHAVALFAREPETLVVERGFPEALRARQVAHVRAGPPKAPD